MATGFPGDPGSPLFPPPRGPLPSCMEQEWRPISSQAESGPPLSFRTEMLAFRARGAGQFSGPPAGCLGTEAPGPEIDSGDPELLFSLWLPRRLLFYFF